MSCGGCLTKGFILITFLFLLTGLCMLIAGLVIQIRFNEYLSFIKSDLNLLAFIMIWVGFGIMIAGCLGTCGAAKKEENMLVGFSLLVLLVICVEFVVAVIAAYNKKQTESDLRDFMVELTMNYNKNESGGVKETWDYLHQKFQCCGTNGIKDWSDKKILPKDTAPDSCCKVVVEGCANEYASKNATTFDKGCFDVVKDKMFSDIALFIGAVLGFLAIQMVLGLLAACVRYCIESEVSSSS